jgi:hypothetical protein
MVLAGARVACAHEKVALVIGNSHYSNASLNLENASKDARDVAASLEKLGFRVILQTDLGLNAFKEALSEFAREAEQSDMALVYYAGHGVQFKGENYFLPVDNVPRDNKDIKFRSVAMSEVVDAASYSQKIKIIVLDACRNSVTDPGKKGTRSVIGIGDASGLAPIAGSDGMIVFYSAEHGHQAYDAALGSANSPFAASLVHRLSEPGKDVKEVFTEVSKDVLEATDRLQHPEIVTAELTTNVYLNPAETAELVWKRIRESTNPQVFRDFIRQFPESDLADAAQGRLDKFDAQQRHEEDERARKEAEAKAAAAAAAKDAAEQRAAAMREEQKAQAEKLKAEKEASDRDLAEKMAQIEASRKAAAQQIADQNRRALEAAAESERAAKENAAKEAEARRLAQEAASAKAKADAEADTKARETAREQAEAKAAQARQAAEDAQKLEAAKQAAKLEEEEQQRRVAEEKAKAQAEACANDRSALGELRETGNAPAIQALRTQSSCASIGPDVDAALKEVASREAAQCAADQKMAAGAGATDLEAIKTLLPSLKCAKVVQAETSLVARLEEAAIAQEKVCSDDRVKLAAVDLLVPNARDAVQALSSHSACAAVRAAAEATLAAIDKRVKEAQIELAHVGCLTAPQTGRFDANTVTAVQSYLKQRNASAQDIRITDAFVEELRRQDFKVCPAPAALVAPAAPVANKPAAPAQKSPRVIARTPPEPHAIARAPVEEREPAQKPARPRRVEIVREEPRAPVARRGSTRHSESQTEARQPEAAPALGTGF